jgi:membrane fusion protein, multidrug efflux system
VRRAVLAPFILVVLATAGCQRGTPPAKAAASEPPPLPADVRSVAPSPEASPGASAEGASVPGRLSATGEFVSTVRSELVPKLGGRVARVRVDQGARVHPGQPLLELETDYLRLAMEQASAEAQRARSAAEDAERDFARKQELIGKGSVTQAVHDRSKAAFDQAKATRQAAEATLALARQHLADAVLVSPIDGVVMERRVDVGERLKDDSVAFVLVQTAPLKLRFRVPERFLAVVHPGQPVKATVDPYPEESFPGHVATVVGAVDPASRTFGVEAEFDNRDGRLRPGLFARVELDLEAGGPRAQAR